MGIVRRFTCAIALLGTVSMASGCASMQSRSPRSPRATEPAAEQRGKADSLPTSLDGLAFVRDGKLYLVTGMTVSEIVRDGRIKLAAVSGGPGALLVTEEQAAGAGVVLVDGARMEPGRTLLRVAEASTLLAVRFGRLGGQLYRAIQGDPGARLLKSPIAAPSTVKPVSLPGGFSGEFDVDASSGGIVYTSATQGPARLLAVGGPSRARELTSALATIFAPAISAKGDAVCFTGQKRSGDQIALWVLAASGGPARRLASTAGLVPTHPVFSEDGQWIAYRGGDDGLLRVVRVDGTQLQTTPFSADDAPFAW